MIRFNTNKTYSPKGDQKKVIESISKGLSQEQKFQTIFGSTGTGKTYVMAKIIEEVQSPALVLAHNKTLAAQLYREFCHFLPNNAVEYFVSYYDYYQPEAYVAKRDLYIEKESSINEEIDRMRLKATASLIERKDVVVVSSVSCIYGLGSPEDYMNMYLTIEIGNTFERREFLQKLISIQYERNDDLLKRGSFRVRGDTIDIIPAYLEMAYRIEFFGDEVEAIYQIDPLNNKKIAEQTQLFLFAAKHFVMPKERIIKSSKNIEKELISQLDFFEKKNKLLEKERINSRTLYDLEMLRSVGTCPGIENYSRHLANKKAGEKPYTLLDYFPKNFLIFIDESHVTLPQVRGMFNGDRARKTSLVDYGFRLPSALDNRPLVFEEFLATPARLVFVSATPGDYEIDQSKNVVELINRPTGLIDPPIYIRPTEGQIDDLIFEIKKNIDKGYRIIVTTLTKKMSEELAVYLKERQIKTRYLHSEIETIERVEILKALRQGVIDVVIGINLLREGLDLPEVSLVAILDADKIGFLRSKTALIQTVGRAARNENGYVIMYADKVSSAMQGCIDETNRKRNIQLEFNKKYNITPKSIVKPITDILEREKKTDEIDETDDPFLTAKKIKKLPLDKGQIKKQIKQMEVEMQLAADKMEFEKAIRIREQIKKLSLQSKA